MSDAAENLCMWQSHGGSPRAQPLLAGPRWHSLNQGTFAGSQQKEAPCQGRPCSGECSAGGAMPHGLPTRGFTL